MQWSLPVHLITRSRVLWVSPLVKVAAWRFEWISRELSWAQLIMVWPLVLLVGAPQAVWWLLKSPRMMLRPICLMEVRSSLRSSMGLSAGRYTPYMEVTPSLTLAMLWCLLMEALKLEKAPLT